MFDDYGNGFGNGFDNGFGNGFDNGFGNMQGQQGFGTSQYPQGQQQMPYMQQQMPYMQAPQAMQNPYMAGQHFQVGVNPLNISFNKQGEMKTPAASNTTIRAFIANQLNMPISLIEFVQVSEPFAGRGTLKHACKFNMLNIEEIPIFQLQYFDKASIDVAFCQNCLKVIYYFERLSY